MTAERERADGFDAVLRCRRSRRTARRRPSLKLRVGGAKVAAEVADRVTPALGCRLQQVFGMAEGS